MKLSDITTYNTLNFLQGYYNTAKHYLDTLPQHIQEQAIHRAVLCSDCLKLGKCKVCKCSTPAMFLAPNKHDSMNKWGAMLEKEEWDIFKETLPEDVKSYLHGGFAEVLSNFKDDTTESIETGVSTTVPDVSSEFVNSESTGQTEEGISKEAL